MSSKVLEDTEDTGDTEDTEDTEDTDTDTDARVAFFARARKIV